MKLLDAIILSFVGSFIILIAALAISTLSFNISVGLTWFIIFIFILILSLLIPSDDQEPECTCYKK